MHEPKIQIHGVRVSTEIWRASRSLFILHGPPSALFLLVMHDAAFGATGALDFESGKEAF